MWTRIRVAVLLIGLGLLSFRATTIVTAAPSPPMNVVNHTTKECAQIFRGDECQSCFPAAGWEVLAGSCPAGYTVLDHEAPTDCNLNASPYCCQTVNSDWIGCASFPGHTPSIPIGAILVCITIAGVGLFVLVKRKLANLGPGAEQKK